MREVSKKEKIRFFQEALKVDAIESLLDGYNSVVLRHYDNANFPNGIFCHIKSKEHSEDEFEISAYKHTDNEEELLGAVEYNLSVFKFSATRDEILAIANACLFVQEQDASQDKITKDGLPEELLKELSEIAKMNALGNYTTEAASGSVFDAVVYKNASLSSVDLAILSEWDYYSEAEIRKMLKQEYLSLNSLFIDVAKISYEAGLNASVGKEADHACAIDKMVASAQTPDKGEDFKIIGQN